MQRLTLAVLAIVSAACIVNSFGAARERVSAVADESRSNCVLAGDRGKVGEIENSPAGGKKPEGKTARNLRNSSLRVGSK